jgi:hypothetical protein
MEQECGTLSKSQAVRPCWANERSTGKLKHRLGSKMYADDGRIAHELLGQMGKAGLTWTPELFPSQMMRDLVRALENGTITGMSIPL